MSSEIAAFNACLSRHAADLFNMPSHCRNRNCRRTGRCRGAVSADGELRCITALKENDRKLFALHVSLAELGAEDIRQGKIRQKEKEPFDAFSQRMGHVIAARAFADLPQNRNALSKRLRAMKLTTWSRRPPRPAAFMYCDFGRPQNDAAPRR